MTTNPNTQNADVLALDQFGTASAFDGWKIVSKDEGQTSTKYSTAPITNKHGVFNGYYSGDVVLEKTFSVEDTESPIKLNFDFVEYDSWDGEEFSVIINGTVVSLGNFHFKSDEGESSGESEGISWKYSSLAPEDLNGKNSNGVTWNDQLHSVELEIPASYFEDGNITVGFSSGTDQGRTDESFAINNVMLSNITTPEVSEPSQPEPAQTREFTEEIAFDSFQTKESFEGWSHQSKINNELSTFNGFYGGGVEVQKTYEIADHIETAKLEFNFLEYDSWDNEEFSVVLNGQKISLGAFSHSIDEGDRSGEADGVKWSFGSSEQLDLNGNRWNDQLHTVELEIDKAHFDDGDLTVGFVSNTDERRVNESFAIDDVRLTGAAASDPSDTPEALAFDSLNGLGYSNDFATRSAVREFGGTVDAETGETSIFKEDVGPVGAGRVISKSFSHSEDTETALIEFDFQKHGYWEDESFSIVIDGTEINLGAFNDNNESENQGARGIQEGVFWVRSESLREGVLLGETGASVVETFSYKIEVPKKFFGSDGNLTVEFKSNIDGETSILNTTGFGNVDVSDAWGIDNFSIREAAPDHISSIPDELSTDATIFDFDGDQFEWENAASQQVLFVDETVNGISSESETITQSFVYDGQNGINIEFDFYELGFWEENDQFSLIINGQEVDLGVLGGIPGASSVESQGARSGVIWNKDAADDSVSTQQNGVEIHHYDIFMGNGILLENATGGAAVVSVGFKVDLDNVGSDESFLIDNVEISEADEVNDLDVFDLTKLGEAETQVKSFGVLDINSVDTTSHLFEAIQGRLDNLNNDASDINEIFASKIIELGRLNESEELIDLMTDLTNRFETTSTRMEGWQNKLWNITEAEKSPDDNTLAKVFTVLDTLGSLAGLLTPAAGFSAIKLGQGFLESTGNLADSGTVFSTAFDLIRVPNHATGIYDSISDVENPVAGIDAEIKSGDLDALADLLMTVTILNNQIISDDSASLTLKESAQGLVESAVVLADELGDLTSSIALRAHLDGVERKDHTFNPELVESLGFDVYDHEVETFYTPPSFGTREYNENHTWHIQGSRNDDAEGVDWNLSHIIVTEKVAGKFPDGEYRFDEALRPEAEFVPHGYVGEFHNADGTEAAPVDSAGLSGTDWFELYGDNLSEGNWFVGHRYDADLDFHASNTDSFLVDHFDF